MALPTATTNSNGWTKTNIWNWPFKVTFYFAKSILTRNKASPPGKYLWQEFFKSPNHSFFFSYPPPPKPFIFSKHGNGNSPPAVTKIAVALRKSSSFWITVEMPLINSKTNLILTWSSNCLISNTPGATTLQILIQNIVLQRYQFKIMQSYYKD